MSQTATPTDTNGTKTGTLSIHTENIFPIIKKFLYANQEVFLRELVANAVDATQKLKTLSNVGEMQGEVGDLTIRVRIDAEAKTLTISDAGIGMTADEVEQYINQIAFSSAEEFLGKYKDAQGIIGHFGLGFYSAFMVADKVELVTKSWKDAPAVKWSNTGDTQFTLEPAERATRGTDVILHVGAEHDEFLQPWRIREILNRHGKFLPIPVEFEGEVINNVAPLWAKNPADLSEQDYKDFYNTLYPLSGEAPLFWVHLNVDYPFRLTGILYFPRLRQGVDMQKNKIQLYSNQVFITDNVEDIVPDYLALLHGVIDSPDIPLNVSRSYLQTDAAVKKISGYISKKVADKLNELFHDDRPGYEAKWENVGVFVKYGMIRDSAFADRVEKSVLVYDTDQKLYTLPEWREHIQAAQTDKDNKVVYLYANDAKAQDGYIQAATRKGYHVLLLDGILDTSFLQYMEHRVESSTWVRVDAGPLDKLVDKGVTQASLLNETEEAELKTLFEEIVKVSGGSPLTAVQFEALGEDELPVVITRPEHQRRLQDMARMGMLGNMGELPEQYNVIINTAHPAAKTLLLATGEVRTTKARHLYDLARLQQGLLTGSALTDFVRRSATM